MRILFDDPKMKKRASGRICKQFWLAGWTRTQISLYDFHLYHKLRLRQAIFHNEAVRIAACQLVNFPKVSDMEKHSSDSPLPFEIVISPR
jgi:hypothetical protein